MLVCVDSPNTHQNFTLLTCSGQGPIIVETCANEAVPQGKTDHLRVSCFDKMITMVQQCSFCFFRFVLTSCWCQSCRKETYLQEDAEEVL